MDWIPVVIESPVGKTSSAAVGGAILKLQIGPVQEFIAQARSTRDLWSGSYLLSWLLAAGLSKLVLKCGGNRDVVIYPNLQEQPLLDFHLGGRDGGSLGNDHSEVLTPNLPNIFVAKVPLDNAIALAAEVEGAIREEWSNIAKRCWRHAHDCLGAAGEEHPWKEDRYYGQVERFLYIAWQVAPIPTDAADVSNYAEGYRQVSWLLDGVRQNRAFSSWRAGGWGVGAEENKDSLSGKEELVAGQAAWWEKWIKPIAENKRGDRRWLTLFRERRSGERYGAITLIKRTWHWAYLHKVHGLHSLHRSFEAEPGETMLPFPSTLHIATHDPAKNEDDPEEPALEDEPDRLEGYFAVLAFDGDRIGQWVSGRVAPPRTDRESWHRTFSRRLTVFALHCVRQIVNACEGRLIYAGGDDVLALLPADTVLECARFLRDAYRGDPGFLEELKALATHLQNAHLLKGRKPPARDSPFLERAAAGELFSKVKDSPTGEDSLGEFNASLPLDLPGLLKGYDQGELVRPDASVGIAIGHFKYPLQDAIKAAQIAEKRAKNELGRSALAVMLLKRSGEHVAWGCQWESGGIASYHSMHAGVMEEIYSNRLPHRLASVLTPQLIPDWGLAKDLFQVPTDLPWDQLIRREADYALQRQRGKNWTKDRADQCLESICHYAKSIAAEQKLAGIIGLCQAVAFTLSARGETPKESPTFATS
jgi:CRISPR-associated protein Cmr2